MEFRNIIKLIGAGVTGGYLALKFRGPRKSFDEFVQIYNTLSLGYLRQMENSFLQTMLPEIEKGKREKLEALLDRQPTFLEQLRFFQKHLKNFDELVLKAMGRFCLLKEQGVIAAAAKKRMIKVDRQTYNVALEQLYRDLETSFLDSINRNIPADGKKDYEEAIGKEAPLRERLVQYKERFPNLGAVVFDAVSQFEDKLAS